jgi:hypothetical protein
MKIDHGRIVHLIQVVDPITPHPLISKTLNPTPDLHPRDPTTTTTTKDPNTTPQITVDQITLQKIEEVITIHPLVLI